MTFRKFDIHNLFSILVLVPCFVALPIIAYEVYKTWYLGNELIWTEGFTSLVVCSGLGAIAGLGIFLRLKWARVIALVLFITGMMIWFVIYTVETDKNAHTPTLTLLLIIYSICICILLFFNGNLMEEENNKEREYPDILDK